jgi:multiple sugar transport system ATP-binding protein
MSAPVRPATAASTTRVPARGNASRGSVRLEGIVKRHGTTTVLHGVDLAIDSGEFFVLLGPSGSGKTTTLRILAGLESVSAGRVEMDGEDVTTTPPGERDVAMVFQSYALYPHMSVAANIGFPLRMVKVPPAEVARAVEAAATKVGIQHLLARTPGQLSGGQQQRCALARAIVREPRLFLLDEPLSNLDAKLRLETRLELHALQRNLGVTVVYVTHDQEEAMTLADRIAVFMDGRIVQVGTPREVFARPQTRAVAGFIGTPPMNLLDGVWQGNTVTVAGHALPVAAHTATPREVTLGVRPGDVRVAQGGLPAHVERVEDLGDTAVVSYAAAGALVKQKTDRMAVREGDDVALAFAPQAAHLFDRSTGARL